MKFVRVGHKLKAVIVKLTGYLLLMESLKGKFSRRQYSSSSAGSFRVKTLADFFLKIKFGQLLHHEIT